MQINVEVRQRDITFKNVKEYRAKARLYIFVQGESVIENLCNRFARPHLLYKKLILPEVIKQVPELQNKKFVWSQKAGCPCGCSPGFIVQNMYSLDIYVNVSSDVQEVKETLLYTSKEDTRQIA